MKKKKLWTIFFHTAIVILYSWIGLRYAGQYGPYTAVLYIVWSLALAELIIYFWNRSGMGLLFSCLLLLVAGLFLFPFDNYWLVATMIPLILASWIGFAVTYRKEKLKKTSTF